MVVDIYNNYICIVYFLLYISDCLFQSTDEASSYTAPEKARNTGEKKVFSKKNYVLKESGLCTHSV